MKVYLFGLAAAAFLASPAAAHPQDEAINAVYGKLAAARAASDVDGMSAAFGKGGLLIDPRPGPAVSTEELAAKLRPMAERIKADGAQVGTAYRVERRSIMGDIALDAGYMRQSFTLPGGQPNTRINRFLVTLHREADGSWRIIGDASLPATEEAWNALQKQDGLRFDG